MLYVFRWLANSISLTSVYQPEEYCWNISVTTRSYMRRHLQTYAADNFPDASLDDNVFFPPDKTISNCMHKYMIKLRYNSIDEINIISLVDKWSKEYTEDFTYYWPKTRDDDISGIVNPNDEDDILYHIPCIRNKDLKNSLCSSIWQGDNVNYWISVTRYLHTLYNILCIFPAWQCPYACGISICRCDNLILMDATYRIYRLMLPVFFLAVKTNVGYTLNACFQLQSEDATSIRETFSKLKHYLAEH